MAFERVYSVWDYYDGPRSGIADYSGRPHYFLSEWNDIGENYTEIFIVVPIDSETLTLMLEMEQIWREWEAAFHRGEVSGATHPALPGQYAKYQELDYSLKANIAALSTNGKKMEAKFRALPSRADLPKGVMRDLEVEWQEAIPK